jgi:hydrogenase nickel incorporation protein HypA/HybF
MHELSISISIIEVATEELERQGGGTVESVHLKLGPLSGVVKEALLSAYELACEETPLAGSRLIVQDVPVEIYCSNCHTHRAVESIQSMQCCICGKPSAEITSGRELEIVAMEICDEQAASPG